MNHIGAFTRNWRRRSEMWTIMAVMAGSRRCSASLVSLKEGETGLFSHLGLLQCWRNLCNCASDDSRTCPPVTALTCSSGWTRWAFSLSDVMFLGEMGCCIYFKRMFRFRKKMCMKNLPRMFPYCKAAFKGLSIKSTQQLMCRVLFFPSFTHKHDSNKSELLWGFPVITGHNKHFPVFRI